MTGQHSASICMAMALTLGCELEDMTSNICKCYR